MKDCYSCNMCSHVFYSEDLLYFHLLKTHLDIVEDCDGIGEEVTRNIDTA